MKKILTVLIVAVMLAVGANAAFEKINTYNDSFSDVSKSSWYADNVKMAYELGFMNGKSENLFDPNGNVTVAEGITMASRLHAIYNGTEVKKREVSRYQYRFDFDSMNGVTLRRATGSVKDGILVMQPDKPNDKGSYDPGFTISRLSLDTARYNKLTIRMKRDFLPNPNPNEERGESLELFFATSADSAIDANKAVFCSLEGIENLEEWFEVEIDFSKHEKWVENLVTIRLDPTNNNGVYYIDYLEFSEGVNAEGAKWYEMYVDYAIDNGIIAEKQYGKDDFTRNATRSEICDFFAAALPESYFGAINDIKGIPDVLRDSKNADVYLMLYKAGVLLGSDSEGTFNGKADVKRSEVAAIINRVALPENRVKGTISADWKTQGNVYDLEFNDEESIRDIVFGDTEYARVENGALVVKALDKGPGASARFDPKMTVKNIAIDAEEYSKLMVRMKVEYIGKITSQTFDFFFTTEEGENFSEAKSVHQDVREYGYVDPAGWYVMEVDLLRSKEWKGTINSFRFDPGNTGGIFTIDYIRLAKGDILRGASHEVLLAEGYKDTRLLQDEHFERGFLVAQFEHKNNNNHGKWQSYCETDEAPLWRIDPWYCKYDLWDNRDTTTDKYTLADKYGINTIKYNPEEKSISMRMNATKIYNGEPHIDSEYNWWPHLLLEQNTDNCPIDKVRNSAAADRMYVELDARLTDFKPTTNLKGSNSCDFLIYFYLKTDKSPTQMIWYGLQLFCGSDLSMPIHRTGWTPDSAANQYMYGLRMNTVYGGMENSFNPQKGVALISDEWKHIRLDITPYIEQCVAWANRDNLFGVQVTKEDMYFYGVNIGYEVHGNFDCTFEFKNFNMVAYNK